MTADPEPASATSGWESAVDELRQLDAAVYEAIAATSTPSLDVPLRRLSDTANYSVLWLGVSAVLAATRGVRGRRAAVTGLISVGVTSLLVNQGVKRLADRPRPDRDGSVAETRHVQMPESTSFPSGHSASAFAFATAVARELPIHGAVLRFLAAAVAYSRVHTGVHYPGDAIIGSLIGAGVGSFVSALSARLVADGDDSVERSSG